MPLKRNPDGSYVSAPQVKTPTQPNPPSPIEPSFLDRLGGWTGAGAAAIRGTSGLLSAGGLLPGAAISGAGELGAEALEGSLFSQSPLRSIAKIGTAAGIGLIPFGSTLKAGHALESLGRSAAYSGGGELAREIAAGEGVDPRRVMTSAGIGGVTGGVLGKFLGMFGPGEQAAVKATKPVTYDIQTTTQTGPGTQTLGGGKLTYGLGKKPDVLRGAKVGPVVPPGPITATEMAPSSFEQYKVQAQAKAAAARAKKQGIVAPEATLPEEPFRGTAYPEQETYAVPGTESGRVQKIMGREAKAADKETANREALDRIETAIAAAGAKRGAPSFGESLSAKGPEGERVSMRTPIQVSVEEKTSGALKKMLGVSEKTSPNIPVPQTTAPAVESPESALLQFFKTRSGATGKNYRLAKEAAAKGEIPTAEYAREARLREIPAKPAAAAAPVDTIDFAKVDQEAVPDWVREQNALIDKFNSEKGFIASDLPTRLAAGGIGAAIGAPVGASMSDEQDKKTGAVLGGLAGGAAGLGAPNVAQALSKFTAGGAGEAFKKAVELAPKWQRFSMLTSNPNSLLANILVGPMGSAEIMGLEKGMSFDTRGWKLLRELLNVKQLAKDFGGSLLPAEQTIGRAEGEIIGPGSGTFDRALASPGTAMTAGDMMARNAIRRAGFTEPQARTATLTSEPELFAFKKAADFGKGTPGNKNDLTKSLLDMSFPFRRTLANIGEQGLFRVPGAGFLTQLMRKNPDPLGEQVAQQVLNAGIGTGSYALGKNLDPESARTARKYVTNAAGPHSLMAGAGFAAGQAMRAGKSPFSTNTLQEVANALPLPTHQAFIDWLKTIGAAAQGEVKIPRGMIPFRNWDLSGAPTFGEAPASTDPRLVFRRRTP